MSRSRNPDDPDFPHGTTFGYRLGDRCEACREAKRLDWQAYKVRQEDRLNPFEDFEGQNGEANKVADLLKDLVLKVRCDCGEWHEEATPDFQCPSGALMPDVPDPEVQ